MAQKKQEAQAVTKALGRKLRQAREDAGLTQEQLAVPCGFTRSTVAAIEAGITMPRLHNLEKLANYCGRSLWDLLPENPSLGGRDSNPEPTDSHFRHLLPSLGEPLLSGVGA